MSLDEKRLEISSALVRPEARHAMVEGLLAELWYLVARWYKMANGIRSRRNRASVTEPRGMHS